MNGISANYSDRWLRGTGSAASSSNDTGFSYWPAIYVDGSSDTTNTFGNFIVSIPNYAGSTAKVMSWDAVTENNASFATQMIGAGLQASTAAVTSLTLTAGTLFAVGSTFSLYGLTHF
jgi:hypothetical protein